MHINRIINSFALINPPLQTLLAAALQAVPTAVAVRNDAFAAKNRLDRRAGAQFLTGIAIITAITFQADL